MNPRLRKPVLLLSVAILAACGGSDNPAGDGGPNDDGVVEVRLLSSLRFSPANITIEPGTTVRWLNTTNLSHTVTPDGHAEWIRFATSRSGEMFEHTFDAAGDFPYFCEPHRDDGMVGGVTVR